MQQNFETRSQVTDFTQLQAERDGSPVEAAIEGVRQQHLSGGFSLTLALGSEHGKIRAALDAARLVPGALTVAHQHHPFGRRDGGESGRRRNPELR